jgi:WD40 repeat protein
MPIKHHKEGRMQASDFSDVFVSYRRKDVEFTKQLVAALQKEGKECWIDWEDIPPGSEGFTDDIKRGLEGADAFIAILSPDYLDSTYCVDMELGTAIKLNKKIIPIVLKKFDDKPIPHGIGHINWIYFTPHAGHDNTFAESFPKVLDALNLDLAHARAHKNFALRALDWDTHKRHTSRLLKGQELDNAETWLANAAGKEPEPTDLHRDYILTGRKVATQQQRRLLAGVSAALVVSVILAILSLIGFQRATVAESEARTAEAAALAAEDEAVTARNEAVVAKDAAQRSAEVNNSLALAAAALEPGNENIALALALEATRIENPPVEILISLMKSAYAPGKRNILTPDVKLVDFFGLAVFEAGISPDGQQVIIQNRLFDLTTGEKIREFPDAPLVSVIARFLPDGKRVIIAGDESFEEQSIRAGLFDVETGALLQDYDFELGVESVWLSADASQVALTHLDTSMVDTKRITLFDVETGAALQTIEPIGSAIAFNADFSRWIEAVVSTDEVTTTIDISLYDVVTDDPIISLSLFYDVPYNQLNAIAFSPDGTQFAVADSYGRVAIYDAEAGSEIKSRTVNNPQKLQYSPDKRYLLITTNYSSQILLWDTLAENKITPLIGHEDTVLFAGFAAGSDRAVSLDNGGTLIEWDLQNRHQNAIYPTGDAWINAAANELFIMSGFLDDMPNELIRVSLETNAEMSRVALSETLDYTVAFSADFSQLIVENTETLSLQLMDVASGNILQEIPIEWTLPNADNQHMSVRFLPDKPQALVFLNENQWIEPVAPASQWLLWDFGANSVEPYAPLNTEAITALSPNIWKFHPDGKSLYFFVGEFVDDQYEEFVIRLDFATGTELERLETPSINFTGDGAKSITLENQDNGQQALYVRDVQTGDIQQTIKLDFAASYANLFDDTHLNRHLLSYRMETGFGGGISPTLSFGTGTAAYSVSLHDAASGRVIWDFGDEVWDAIGFDATFSQFVVYDNAGVAVYRNDSLEELIAWTCANRYVPQLTEEDKARFRITSTDSVCNA